MIFKIKLENKDKYLLIILKSKLVINKFLKVYQKRLGKN